MGYEIEMVELPEQHTAVVRGAATTNGIADFLGGAFGEVMSTLASAGVRPIGPAFARYQHAADGEWAVEGGFVLAGRMDAGLGRVEPSSLPAGTAVRTLHVGDYAGVGAAHDAVETWLGQHGQVAAGPPWECYLDGPDVAQPRTEVFQPCRPA